MVAREDLAVLSKRARLEFTGDSHEGDGVCAVALPVVRQWASVLSGPRSVKRGLLWCSEVDERTEETVAALGALAGCTTVDCSAREVAASIVVFTTVENPMPQDLVESFLVAPPSSTRSGKIQSCGPMLMALSRGPGSAG